MGYGWNTRSAEDVQRYNNNVTKTTTKDLIAKAQLELIISVFNGDWKADFKDKNQKKYYCWFEQTKSGFGFSDTDYDYTGTDAGVGARLCFKNREDAEYVGKTFVELFEQYLTYMDN